MDRLRSLLYVMLLACLATTAWTAFPQSAKVPAKYSAKIFASGLNGVRELRQLPNGDLIALERSLDQSVNGQITRLWDFNGDGMASSSERMVIGRALGINHALVVKNNYIYASSETVVYRWGPFDATRKFLSNPVKVIVGIPAGDHVTRTLLFDRQNRFYVTKGSEGNDDDNPAHAIIRRFNIFQGALPKAWTSGEVFARGLRNEVGIALDNQGELWGVENGFDQISDHRGDIDTQDNPAEELNRFYINQPGLFYGYPKCLTGVKVPGYKPGTQFGLEPSDDGWCRNRANNMPPAFMMQGHSAPINIVFYPPSAVAKKWGFPAANDAFVSLHGSWDRDIPTGYRVIRIRFKNNWPTTYEPFFWFSGSSNSSATAHDGWGRRPTGLTVGSNGELYVGDDAQGDIVRIVYTK